MQRRSRPDTVTPPLETYLRDIDRTPLLSAEEEKRLAERVAQGDSAARDHMVRANLRLVVRLARRYAGRSVSLQDLIAEGNLGLLRAVEAFDPALDTRFSTYAAYWIRQSVKHALVRTGRTIRIPAYMNELLIQWRRAARKLEDALGRPPTEEEISKRLHLPPKRLAILKKATRIYSATPRSEEKDGGSALDRLLADKSVPSPDSHLMRADDLQQVLGLLARLRPHEAEVLRLRFGLDGQEPQTLQEIGSRLDLTRERVRQIERAALRRLSTEIQP